MTKNKIMFAILGLAVFGLAVWAASMREPMGGGPGISPGGNTSSTQGMVSSSVQTSSTNGGISITIETPTR